jgi:hypothetical protein
LLGGGSDVSAGGAPGISAGKPLLTSNYKKKGHSKGESFMRNLLKEKRWIKYAFLLLDTFVSFFLTKQQNTTLYIG